MSDTPSIRRWVYDPKAPRPVWVFRKFHDIRPAGSSSVRFPAHLSSVNFGDASPGDTICMDVAMGNYWVEKPKEAAK